MKLSSVKRGFTLIELLVVIAIIGILSSVVLASLGTARSKARDATRISDMKNIQLALELYYDGSQTYPNQTAAGNYYLDPAGGAGTPNAALVPSYIPNMPLDPQNTARGGAAATDGLRYSYVALSAANAECVAAATCVSYLLGATLERTDNLVLATDYETAAANIGSFYSQNTTGCAEATAAAATDYCYSLHP